ncbi:Conserved_hypothetical protein [Hexamita inflata]|uniref:Transmembrane protein n=1 Tax=Hexamita inflata TaxID=28002 RepID=A0AA86RWL8_9EUKA|nr:Conserved hypothetical protein [Hexamita inflata]
MMFVICLNYIQEEQSTQIVRNCFKSVSFIQLQKQTRQFILNLYPTSNYLCLSLSGDIQVNLTLLSVIFPSTLFVFIKNYDYLNTNQIVLHVPDQIQQLDSFQNEFFVNIAIFNIKHLTQIQLRILEELKSDLSNCYSDLQIKIIDQQISIHLDPKQTCTEQIILKEQNDERFVKNATIVIDQFTFQLNINNLVNAYQNQLTYNEIIIMQKGQLNNIMQNSFINSQLNITIQQGNRNFSVIYDVNVNTDYLSDIFTTKEVYLYNYEDDFGYQIYFDFKQQGQIQFLEYLDNLNYDLVEYRLTLAILKTNLVLTQTADKFDDTLRSIQFSCKQGAPKQQNTCNSMLDIDYGALLVVPRYNLDIRFYFNRQLVYLQQISKLQSIYTCWNSGVALLNKSGVNIVLTRTGKCDNDMYYYDYSNIQMWLVVRNATSNHIVFNATRFVNIGNSTHLNDFFWNCSEINCSLLNINQTFTFRIQEYIFFDEFVVEKVMDLRGPNKIYDTLYIMIGIVFICVLPAFWLKRKYSAQMVIKYRGMPKHKKDDVDTILRKQLIQQLLKQ